MINTWANCLVVPLSPSFHVPDINSINYGSAAIATESFISKRQGERQEVGPRAKTLSTLFKTRTDRNVINTNSLRKYFNCPVLTRTITRSVWREQATHPDSKKGTFRIRNLGGLDRKIRPDLNNFSASNPVEIYYPPQLSRFIRLVVFFYRRGLRGQHCDRFRL
jgi:hypothetical protein